MDDQAERVDWVAGEDDIEITAAVTGVDGSFGSVTCDAHDADGHFDFPREAHLVLSLLPEPTVFAEGVVRVLDSLVL